MTKLYITHITVRSCRSYIVENNKQSINEWYQKHTMLRTMLQIMLKKENATNS